MGTSDLAPDHADLGAADLLLGTRDIGDLLAEVEAAATVNIITLQESRAGREGRTWRSRCCQRPRS